MRRAIQHMLIAGLGILLLTSETKAFSPICQDDATSQARQPQERAAMSDLAVRAERRYLRNAEHVTRYRGDYEVRQGETVDGAILIDTGNLAANGNIHGDLVVVEGNVTVGATAMISGKIVSINGQITRETGSRVDGEMIETVMHGRESGQYNDAEFRRDRSERRHDYTWRERWESRWRDHWRYRNKTYWLDDEDPVLARYNRVDGIFFGANVPAEYRRQARFLDLGVHGFVGYAFASKAWRYQATGEVWLNKDYRSRIGATVYDLTDTRDDWIISKTENSLAAALIREDFQDYFRREGAGAYFAQGFLGGWELQIGYYKERFSSLEKETDWSLFGGDKRFRSNPAIVPGKSHAYKAVLVYDTRNSRGAPSQGWYIQGLAEWSRPDFGSDFDHDRYVLDIRKYIPVGYNENLDVRLRAGTTRGVLPYQDVFFLGGISSLRGYRYKELAGDRMLLGNLEYRMNAGHNIWFLQPFDVILFVDGGWAGFSNQPGFPDKGFDMLTWDGLRTDFGVALTDDEGRFRANFAKRTDGVSRDLVVTLRLNRAF